MNIKEFNVTEKPFKTTLMFELYEGSDYDKKAHRILKKDKNLFADGKFDNEVFYYDITNKMSLRKYMAGSMDQRRLFYLIERLIDAELCIRESGVDPRYMMYDVDLVLVDKETEEITFIYVPATDHGLVYKPLKPFLREVLANAVYDEMENLDYVGRLLTYINKNKVLDVEVFPQVLAEIKDSHRNMSRIAQRGAVEMAREEAAAAASPVQMMTEEAPVMGAAAAEEVSVMSAAAEEVPVISAETYEEEPALSAGMEKAGQMTGKAENIAVEHMLLEEPAVDEVDDVPVSGIDNLTVREKNTEDAQAEISFEIEEAEAKTETEAKQMPDGKIPVMDIPEAEVPVMRKKYPYLVRAKNQEIITIDKDEFKLGKIFGADYLLSDNPAVSRMHAIIHNVDNTYYICDNYSTNATYLNDERLEPGKNYLLMNGVKVRLANEEFTYICEE